MNLIKHGLIDTAERRHRMTLKQLNQYRYLKKEVKQCEYKLKASIITDTVSGSSPEFPYIQGPRTVRGFPSKEQQELQEAYNRCYTEYLTLCSYINGVDDSQLRMIMRFKFIEGYSWVKTAMLIGGGNTADSCRKSVSRYISKIA